MAEGSDVNYWNLIFLGVLLLGAVMIYVIMKNRKSRVDPEVTERATHELYNEEQRMHERDGNSGL